MNFAKFLRTSFLTEYLRWLILILPATAYEHLKIVPKFKWGKVFKNGPSKICGSQPLKNLK